MSYTARMDYVFTTDGFVRGCELWRECVFTPAAGRKGLIRMEFYTRAPQAFAIGVWEDKQSAESFMQTGVFRNFLEAAEGLLAEKPEPGNWSADSFWMTGH